MAFQHRTGGDVSSGQTWHTEPGAYHLSITSASENPTKRDGKLVENAAFRIDYEIVAGTNPSQVGRTGDILFFHPKPNAKDGGKFQTKKIDRFLLAANFGSRAEIEKPDAVFEFEIERDAPGRQIVVEFEQTEREYNGKKINGVDVAFDHIYHVDDPAVASVPKCADSLKLLPAEERWVGEQAKAASKPKAKAKRETQPAQSAKSASDEWKI